MIKQNRVNIVRDVPKLISEFIDNWDKESCDNPKKYV
jgi:hypothetical protein